MSNALYNTAMSVWVPLSKEEKWSCMLVKSTLEACSGAVVEVCYDVVFFKVDHVVKGFTRKRCNGDGPIDF